MHRADNIATFMCRLSRNTGSPKLVEPSGTIQSCFTGIVYTFKMLVFITVFITRAQSQALIGFYESRVHIVVNKTRGV